MPKHNIDEDWSCPHCFSNLPEDEVEQAREDIRNGAEMSSVTCEDPDCLEPLSIFPDESDTEQVEIQD